MSVTDGDDYPRTPRDGVEKLLGKIDNGLRELREMRNNLLSTAGMSVSTAGLAVASSLSVTGDLAATGNTNIDGTLDVGANTTIGGTLDVTGDAVFSGNLAVPNGSIDNDALVSPVTPDVATGSTGSGVALTGSLANYATATLTVPSGFTKAQVMGISSAYIGGDGIQMRTRIGSNDGDLMNAIPTTSPGLANGSSSNSVILTGLTGGSTISVHTRAQELGTGSTAYMTTTAFAIFYR